MDSSYYSKFFSLEFNSGTGEPYIRLLPPYEHFILTPPRPADVAVFPVIMNDPRVYSTISGPPYPYTLQDAESWVSFVTGRSEKIMAELQSPGGDSLTSSSVSGCPVQFIREIRPDGTDTYAGDIRIQRSGFLQEKDNELRAKLIFENENRPLSDPQIMWEFGYHVAPDYQGKGIMTAALKTVIEKWAKPHMGARNIQIVAFKGNKSSVRVAEKCGFVLHDTVDDCLTLLESRGGAKIGLHVLYWHM